MATVEWADDALAQLDDIFNYIEQFNPGAAKRIVLRLVTLAESLQTSPDRGRPVGANLRELVAVRPFIIRSRIDGDHVSVLRVRHSSRARDDEVT